MPRQCRYASLVRDSLKKYDGEIVVLDRPDTLPLQNYLLNVRPGKSGGRGDHYIAKCFAEC